MLSKEGACACTLWLPLWKAPNTNIDCIGNSLDGTVKFMMCDVKVLLAGNTIFYFDAMGKRWLLCYNTTPYNTWYNTVPGVQYKL